MTPSERMQTVDRLHATLADVADDLHLLGWSDSWDQPLYSLGRRVEGELDFLDRLLEPSYPDALGD